MISKVILKMIFEITLALSAEKQKLIHPKNHLNNHLLILIFVQDDPRGDSWGDFRKSSSPNSTYYLYLNNTDNCVGW